MPTICTTKPCVEAFHSARTLSACTPRIGRRSTGKLRCAFPTASTRGPYPLPYKMVCGCARRSRWIFLTHGSVSLSGACRRLGFLHPKFPSDDSGRAPCNPSTNWSGGDRPMIRTYAGSPARALRKKQWANTRRLMRRFWQLSGTRISSGNRLVPRFPQRQSAGFGQCCRFRCGNAPFR